MKSDSTRLAFMRTILLIWWIGGVWSCPNGWMRHDSSCYHFSHDLESWTGADYMCTKMGGKLVEIETATENAVLKPIVDSMKRNYWIGLSDIQEEGVWVWMSSQTKLSTTGFSSWNKDQPSNSGGNENCASINYNTGGKWNDWHCSGEAYYICEEEELPEWLVTARLYHFSHDLENWTGAAYMCRTMGGKLAEIETAAENSYLASAVDNLNHDFWIGLSDVQEEGVWMWMDSKAKLSDTGFSSWVRGNPDNGGGNENCATMNHKSGGRWNDWECRQSTFYICELDIETEVVG